MGLNRRTFFKQAGMTLLTLGISESFLFSRVSSSRQHSPLNGYLQALASPNGRKLAFLVGVNQYSSQNLKGSVTDVELQRELLIHRFGFQASDILTLTDQQATRRGIEEGFVEHLINQATEDDVVVFHFSGYGRQVKIPTLLNESQQQPRRLRNSLIPVDGMKQEQGEANDLLEDTLGQFVQSLATDKVTLVLDTSYRGTGESLLGNLRLRSLLNSFSEPPTLQQQTPKPLLSKLPGIILSATGNHQVAAEADWDGFSSGLFTYGLTQYLWQTTPAKTLYISLQKTTQNITPFMGAQQQPYRQGQQTQHPLFPYYLLPEIQRGAEGIVTAVEESGKTVQLYLPGLPSLVLEHYEVNSCFQLLPLDSSAKQIQIQSRTGLTAKAQLLTASNDSVSIQVGQRIQESIRVLKNPGLVVALDLNLARIERVDATSAFSNIPVISSTITAGEKAADCLFGRVQLDQILASVPQEHQDYQLTKNYLGLAGGYGLFFAGGVPIPNTVGGVTEAVKSGIERLIPKLNTLLAVKLWRLTCNEGSSRLGIRLTLEKVSPTPAKLLYAETARSQSFQTLKENTGVQSQLKDIVPKIALGSRLQCRLENYSDSPIYTLLLGLDPRSNGIIFYPSLSDETPSGLESFAIASQETGILPSPNSSVDWTVSGAQGMMEVYVVCSQSPFTKTLETLAATQHPQGTKGRVVELADALEVTRMLLADLHQGSGVPSEIYGATTETYALDVRKWATFSFLYEVV